MFTDRRDAGRRLADALAGESFVAPIVLALPRGGVPVGAEIARRLEAPLDVFVVRKLGAPGRPELAVGALAEGGTTIVDRRMLDALGVTDAALERILSVERVELERRVRLYRGDRALPDVTGRDVILVDDGLATGLTARAAIVGVTTLSPGRVVLAAPVGAADTVARLTADGFDVHCLLQPADFRAVGRWYLRFGQTTDAEVIDLLK